MIVVHSSDKTTQDGDSRWNYPTQVCTGLLYRIPMGRVDVSRLDDLFAPYPEHLSVEQLASVLGVQSPTAYRWLQKGLVPAYKVGTSWVIVRDEVKDYLEANRNRPREDEDEGSSD